MEENPKPGTVVRVRDRIGVVMHYEMQWKRQLFPVRFADGVWEIVAPPYAEVVDEAESRT